MKRKQIVCAVIINGIVFLSVSAVILLLMFSESGNTGRSAAEETFRYFTNLSNIYCALVSLAVMIYEITMLKENKTEIPHPLLVLKQTGTAAAALTFFTVLCFLAPASGRLWYHCYTGYMFFLHFMNPLLAILCFIFLEKGRPLSFKEDLLALIPTICYEAVYASEVLILKNWEDFYGFTFGGKPWAPFAVIPAMIGVTYLLSFLLSSAQKKRFCSAI